MNNLPTHLPPFTLYGYKEIPERVFVYINGEPVGESAVVDWLESEHPTDWYSDVFYGATSAIVVFGSSGVEVDLTGQTAGAPIRVAPHS